MKTTRRTFLGGLAVAAIPATAATSAAVTAAQMEPSALQVLIDAYMKADVEAELAIEFENSLLDLPGKPEWPMVKAREFGRHLWPMRTQEYYCRPAIEAVFDEEDGRINKWLEFFAVDGEGNPAPASEKNVAERDRRLARNDADRKAVLALYAERQKIWDDWAGPSGYAEASDRSNELDELRCDLVEEVLAFKVATIDDVLRKACFIEENYCGEKRASLAADLIKEIAEIRRASA
ncbi:hypothetical protein EGT36_21320 [Agrobacterium sp. FDAARGOS_525]|uniref:hypothetical protein n=1 Tax=Agrobacterium sp. FDAARGOS_525 TaxID=2420311 RepID=UPI000F667954|nr:hypothetical protein [Agrobacterium sp. FDAARGOS_525]RSC31218.1 hypothetical protein EGT36_21320 [Agrobacterium sp. FDAARGOS_525]